MWTWRPTRNSVIVVWAIGMVAVFGNYFYHMLTLPDRWEKIVDLFERLTP
jgi:hypothetical protein